MTRAVLEHHLVGVISFAEPESGPKVLLQQLAVSHLVGLPLLAGLVLLLLGLENVTLLFAGGGGGLLGSSSALEVSVVDVVGNLDARHVDLGLGGQQVPLVHPAKRAAVQGVGAADQEEAGAELLENDDLLSLVDSSQDDGDD